MQTEKPTGNDGTVRSRLDQELLLLPPWDLQLALQTASISSFLRKLPQAEINAITSGINNTDAQTEDRLGLLPGELKKTREAIVAHLNLSQGHSLVPFAVLAGVVDSPPIDPLLQKKYDNLPVEIQQAFAEFADVWLYQSVGYRQVVSDRANRLAVGAQNTLNINTVSDLMCTRMKLKQNENGWITRMRATVARLEKHAVIKNYQETNPVPELFQPSTEPPGISAEGITSRRLQVIELVAQGHTNDEIGEILNISAQTVKNHITSIIRLLGVRPHRSAIITEALRRGLI